MNKWYQSETVHGALVGGFFVLIAALISGYFILRGGAEEENGIQTAEDQVRNLRDSAHWIKGIYEGVDQPAQPGDLRAATVRERAPFIAEQFLRVADRSLDERQTVIKYCFAGMLFVLAGQLEADLRTALRNAKSAQGALASCRLKIEKAQAGTDEESHKATNWIGRNSYRDWMAYNTAIALSLEARAGGSVTWLQVEQALSQISQPYLERDPLETNLTLSWACQNLAGDTDTRYCKGG